MKKAIIAGSLGLIAVLYASPYYAVYQFQEAIRSKNTAKLNSLIDYPAVKESLKKSLSQTMSAALLTEKTDNGMNAFATMFANAFVNPLVDTLITPDNLALMLSAKQPDGLDKETTDIAPSKTTQDLEFKQSYQGINTFVVDVYDSQQPTLVFNFEFSRTGILSWQLTALKIPLNR
ncbi:DUF2939 domain-containing protein [Agitococcus lubricus]|uniref:DUF2939 family protein n=1 Tax=Agitococcus lubricus TaxID=1077255 RepID=A0A2T5IX91_9GAMM|nr:DUF2939 domain-containing protein [Agitococcus lubricus]PTQ88484.1 Protein of unknown function (DUF2939) [Agitococcus lubricus]